MARLTVMLLLTACPAVDSTLDKGADRPATPLETSETSAASASSENRTRGAGALLGSGRGDPTSGDGDGDDDDAVLGREVVQAPVEPESAPSPSPRFESASSPDAVHVKVASYFEGLASRRIYIQIDKPLYQPGETVWVKTWDLSTRDLAGSDKRGIRYELINPKGAVVLEKLVEETNGMATNDLVIPEEVEGGEYTLRVTALDGVSAERSVVVSTYEAPRLKKKLEFVKKAYGEGDEVSATLKIERPTGEALGNHAVEAVVWLDGDSQKPVRFTTNAEGGTVVRFRLPSRIERGDGLLTVMIEDGGVTESISRRIPILMKKLDFAFFPEGGQMVAGLPARVYFEAKNTLGKPADVEGVIVDDHGAAVERFATYHAGLGRVEFTPNTGRRYFAQISKPAGITEKYALPLALDDGCVLRSYDDLDSRLASVRVAVQCSGSAPKKVIVLATMRERVLDEALVEVGASNAGSGSMPAVVHLSTNDETLSRAQGIVRVTVFDEQRNPLAERLVYRNRRNRLRVEITPDKPAYSPRDQVALVVETVDASGRPTPAELALSVVDDTVLSFADDKTGHMLSRLYLESELPDKVEEPNFFFDLTKKKSALAMDLLMGTRGYRRFDWVPVFNPPLPPRSPRFANGHEHFDEDLAEGRMARGGPMPVPDRMPAMRPPNAKGPPAKGRGKIAQVPHGGRRAPEVQGARARDRLAPAANPIVDNKKRLDRRFGMEKEERAGAGADAAGMPVPWDRREPPARQGRGRGRGDDGNFARLAEGDLERPPEWAPVRVFPAPVYRGDETGPRTDFRETIHWAPSVFTGKDGRATVTFYLSDAVTSFRAVAEGVGKGVAGRAEKVLKSSLPFNMAVKLPLEVTAGDRFMLPLTLSNEKDREVAVDIEASFGDRVEFDSEPRVKAVGDDQGVGDRRGERRGDALAIVSTKSTVKTTLPANSRRTVYFPLTATTRIGKSRVRIFANAGGLTDEFVRELPVVPLGFPQSGAAAGTLKDRARHAFDLGAALDGTAELTVKLYPSPVSTLLSGLDGMLREPSGCFEQTSSTNYPNIMVMSYLRAHDVADPDLVQRTNGLIDRGYKRLVGYETPTKGYEWFGQSPPHEALTAYGVLQFVDMKDVYGSVDDAMLARTRAWLLSRRDGRGGFERDAKALDSFGGAKPEVTNAYIVYALTEAGVSDSEIPAEIASQAKLAASTEDAYLLALATNTLLNVPARRSDAEKAVRRLVDLKTKDGSWRGADHSITRSTGINLDIETTSLAILALLKTKGNDVHVRSGIEWLTKNRGGFGEWGATQATVLALKAMTAYSTAARKTLSSGAITLRVNGKNVSTLKYEAGRREPMVMTAVAEFFTKDQNVVELLHDGTGELPYSMILESRSKKPATSDRAVVAIETTFANAKTEARNTEARMGENLRLTVKLKNKTGEGQPMTLARIGLPSGLTFQTWQLKELKDKGLVAFTETRAREVILYFRALKPNEEKVIPLDLVATIPGSFEGPASSAYLYYSNDAKAWTDGTRITIAR
ncbi:MAG: hypothetical protein IPK13_25105 [Deltaproteobacteria bacterium]|nr:hypothetical protein [Deltaproteobacteria bacterium]